LKECPLYPQERTSPNIIVMSALCQKRTFRAAAELALFDHLVAQQRRKGGHHTEADSERLLIGLRVISTAKQDFCNLMCPDARAWDARTKWSVRGCYGSAIHQNDDRTPGIEKTDHVVVIGDAAASVRDVA
jgi:hypothetical protein